MILIIKRLSSTRLWTGLLACILGLTVNPYVANAQQLPIQLRIYGGIETNTFSDIKEWQSEQRQIMRGLGMPVEIVERFPVYYGVRGEAVIPVQTSTRVGLGFGYGSTGGRLHYSDYSGEVYFDQVASRKYAGLILEQRVSSSSQRFNPWGVLNVRYSLSQIDYNSFIRLGQEQEQEEENVKAGGISLEPGIGLELLGGPATARLYAGFEYAITKVVPLKVLNHTISYQGQETRWHVDWTGVRIGLSLGLNLDH
jgi:hypothetical protein